MSGQKVFYVGTKEEVASHAAPLQERLPMAIVEPEDLEDAVRPGDLCIFFNEAFLRFRRAVRAARAKNCATLFAVDGILEWRNTWEYPPPPGREGEPSPDTMRPVLCHKIACLGRAQQRVLESWGNLGKCELVGVPRLDSLRPSVRDSGGARRVLIMTAKTPGFTPEQLATVTQSLHDVRRWFQAAEDKAAEPVWRISPDLARTVGVTNGVPGRGSLSLAETLEYVDAVVTTPSTAMLESMLAGKPTALLDYHNRPHYVPAAWRITCASQLAQVIPQLLAPAANYRRYQDFLLQDALEHAGSAVERFAKLAEGMLSIARECVDQGRPLAFPDNLLKEQTDAPPEIPPAEVAASATAETERELTELRCEVKRLQALVRRIETHPVFGRALQIRRTLLRWLQR